MSDVDDHVLSVISATAAILAFAFAVFVLPWLMAFCSKRKRAIGRRRSEIESLKAKLDSELCGVQRLKKALQAERAENKRLSGENKNLKRKMRTADKQAVALEKRIEQGRSHTMNIALALNSLLRNHAERGKVLADLADPFRPDYEEHFERVVQNPAMNSSEDVATFARVFSKAMDFWGVDKREGEAADVPGGEA